jgi:uncharacterized membrane protein YphA (DoxX/SURF4 family)
MGNAASWSRWTRFWHVPVRAERLAFTRILFAVSLLTDQLFQIWPHLDDFFGPGGVGPAGLYDRWKTSTWHWTVLLFNHDAPEVFYPLFLLWVGVTVAYLLGCCTRTMNVAVWFLSFCFQSRNATLLNGGDETLNVGLFLLMWMPSGTTLSVDAWLRRRRGLAPAGPPLVPAWGVRILQIQLAVIYLSTGLVKLKGVNFEGTWWDGTSIHYVLNYVTMSRISYAQLPLPFWLTATMTYVSVWWETLFPLLVLNRWTRRWALLFGLLFHLGIYLTIEVGWFSFYTLSFYGVWLPDRFWERWCPTEVPQVAVQEEKVEPASPTNPSTEALARSASGGTLEP